MSKLGEGTDMRKGIYHSIRSAVSSRNGQASPVFVGLFTLAVCCLLVPAAARGQSDLVVIDFFALTPEGTPGGELLVDFTITNSGPDSTEMYGFLNYVFVWDVLNNEPETVLSPTDAHAAHTLTSLQPGDIDHHGPISVILPADIPLDTVITLAVIVDYDDNEAEMNEDNNMMLLDVLMHPRMINLEHGGYTAYDIIDLPNYPDVYMFDYSMGEPMVFVEAWQFGSLLIPLTYLTGPEPLYDSLVAMEGPFESIETDSRLTGMFPYPGMYRLTVFGEEATTGDYGIFMQQPISEFEPNGDPSIANPVNHGEIIAGSIEYPGDVDYYIFPVEEGGIYILDFDANEGLETLPDSLMDLSVTLMSSITGDTISWNDDTNNFDPYFFFTVPETGDYIISVEDGPGGGVGSGYPEYQYFFSFWKLEGVIKPDLQPGSISLWSDTVAAGNWGQADLEVWNMGDLWTFAGGVSVDVLLSDDTVVDPDDSLVAVGDFEDDIPAESFFDVVFTFEIPETMPPGPYFLGIVLDPTNNEVEEDETNNVIWTPFYVGDVSTGIPDPNRFPRDFALMQNFPNPVSDRTTITYHLPAVNGRSVSRHVRIDVYNVAGQRVATLHDGPKSSGAHRVSWDAALTGKLSSGVYFYRVMAGTFTQTRRLILIK